MNNYTPGKSVPHIHLQIINERNNNPVQEYVTIKLTGTRESVSFIVDCDPSARAPEKQTLGRYRTVDM